MILYSLIIKTYKNNQIFGFLIEKTKDFKLPKGK